MFLFNHQVRLHHSNHIHTDLHTFPTRRSSDLSNVINIVSLPTILSYPATNILVQSFNPIVLTGGSFNFVLGSLPTGDRKSTRLNSSHVAISYAVLWLKKKGVTDAPDGVALGYD